MSNRWGTVNAPNQISFRGHIAEFDGLRAIGLSLVLINHFWPDGLSIYVFQLGNLGWIAMDSFFVMSGFLITGILLDSRDKPNYFSTYYVRRALRIFPLYYAVLLVWWILIRFENSGNDYRYLIQHWGSPSWFTFYLGNIRTAMVGAWPSIGRPGAVGYVPLWSLQVEEQYYLLFPLAVAWLKREHLRRLLIAAVFISPVLRVLAYLWQPGNLFLQYVLLPCHCEGLALGGLIAIRARGGPWKISRPVLTGWTAGLLAATVLGSLVSTWGTRIQAPATLFVRLAGYSLSSAACACLILWLICFRGSIYTQWMRIAPLQYLGKISYGVYMLHLLAAWILFHLTRVGILHLRKNDPRYFIEAIALSVVLAALSWHFFEAPLLRIKDRVSYYRGKKVAAPVVAG